MKHTLSQDLSLIDALQLYYPESSKRTLHNWIKWGRIKIDDSLEIRAHSFLKTGQTIEIQKKELNQTVMGIPILYQDRWIIVIDKPIGLLSVPAEKESINALHLLKLGVQSPSILPVHRLDQETSGVLVFARSKLIQERFNLIFEKHDLERYYIAIVEGHFPHRNGTWECYLREKENFQVEISTPELGKRAITHYELIRRSKKFSFLRFKLETGRKHQIRVQAAHAGFPIVGDKRYGSLINPFKRLCLHAHSLSFVHPFMQKKMLFVSKLKDSWSTQFHL